MSTKPEKYRYNGATGELYEYDHSARAYLYCATRFPGEKRKDVIKRVERARQEAIDADDYAA